MKIAVIATHIGSNGPTPSNQHGGGELHTFSFLKALDQFYDVWALTPPGFYPAFDQANDYGIDLRGINWTTYGDDFDWIRHFDVMISMNHSFPAPPLCYRNILSVFFPQYPEWESSIQGYDTIIANSKFTASWIKHYWKRDADVVYPPIPIDDIRANRPPPEKKKKVILGIGRFFSVPDGNNKNHAVLIKAFQEMYKPDWELHLIGAVQDPMYYNHIRGLARDDNRIKFLHDIPRAQYVQELADARFIWAATGYLAKKPSSQEHFGIFPVEGMAAGSVPVVYAGGGTPETGCLTWEDPRELTSITLEFIKDKDAYAEESNRVAKAALQFSYDAQTKKLIQIVERPVVIMPNQFRGKVYISRPDPKDVTIATWSDDPRATTGFGVLTNMIGSRLREKGYNVVSVGWQHPNYGPSYCDQPWPVWNGCRHDPNGWENLDGFLDMEQPNAWYLNYDPGNIGLMLNWLSNKRVTDPIVAYMPIESSPVIQQYIQTIRNIKMHNGDVLLYTRWAQQQVLKAGGPQCDYIHHGNDHADFRLPPDGVAKELRRAVGWDDKFVVVSIGRNKVSKNLATLIYAAQYLAENGHNDIRWYIHTNPKENLPNSSVPLDELVKIKGLEDIVLFPRDLSVQSSGVPYDQVRKITVPESNDPRVLRGYNIMAMTLIERLWMAEPYGCYANASLAEGFGLTPLEAMGCGVPVVSVNDYGVQQEVMGQAPYYVKPVDQANWGTWNTGGRLPYVDPRHLAEAILQMKNDSELRNTHKNIARKHWEGGTKWEDVATKVEDLLMRRLSL